MQRFEENATALFVLAFYRFFGWRLDLNQLN